MTTSAAGACVCFATDCSVANIVLARLYTGITTAIAWFPLTAIGSTALIFPTRSLAQSA